MAAHKRETLSISRECPFIYGHKSLPFHQKSAVTWHVCITFLTGEFGRFYVLDALHLLCRLPREAPEPTTQQRKWNTRGRRSCMLGETRRDAHRHPVTGRRFKLWRFMVIKGNRSWKLMYVLPHTVSVAIQCEGNVHLEQEVVAVMPYNNIVHH